MIHTIVFIVGLIFLILAIIAGFIVAYEKENNFPRWMSYNWPVLFMMYASIVGICYFLYLVYPYLVSFLHWLRGLGI